MNEQQIKEVANNIKQIRKNNGLTQKEFSLKIGLSRNYISDLEAGKYKPSLDVVMKICNVFKVTTSEILGG